MRLIQTYLAKRKLKKTIQGFFPAFGNYNPEMARCVMFFSNEIASISHYDFTLEAISKHLDSASWCVRRVMIHAIRLSSLKNDPSFFKKVAQKLDDQNDWVKYDAAWMLKESDINDSDALQKLGELGAVELAEDSDEPIKKMREMAAEAFEHLSSRN